ncbi:19697_t:CDS:2, partial [Dentiscutata erythropus]
MDSVIKPTKCCYFVPLKVGVIIITLFWPIESIVLIIYFTSIIKNERLLLFLVCIIVASSVLLDTFGIIGIALFSNHDIASWIIANAVDFILS